MAKKAAISVFTGVWAPDAGVLHIFNSFSTRDHVNIRKMDSYPLSTTFDHILRLSSLLSIGKFQVETHVSARFLKARDLVVNQIDDH